MNIKSLYQKIEQYALNTKCVESYTTGDPYIIWNALNMKYGAFSSNINYIQRTDNYDVLNMTLYYGDRLKNDSSNIYDVQTDGFNAIINVINHLKDDFEVDSYDTIQFYPFNQKFADILAGAYADVNIYIPIDNNCEDYDKQ